MISQPTVCVVGAGASEPYGFPLGTDLVFDVVALMNDDVTQLTAMTGIRQDKFRAFGTALFRSGKNSVDAFLEHRPDFIDVGKIAMAHRLIRCEMTDALLGQPKGHWLRYVYGRMNAPFDEFGKNRVSFITFNYDRNIEHFLHTALCNGYPNDPKEVAEQLSTIPIVHLHGNLGPLPWQSARGRHYRPDIDAESLAVASSGIKIIHEDLGTRGDEDFARAKDLLAQAESVVLLGYGFNAINTQRLGLSQIHPKRLYTATAVGLTGTEMNSIIRVHELGGRLNLRQNVDCANIVREIEWL